MGLVTAAEFKRRRDRIEKGIEEDEEMMLKKRRLNEIRAKKLDKRGKLKKKKMAKLSFIDDEDEDSKL